MVPKVFQNSWKSFGACLAKLKKKNISTNKTVKNSLRHVCQTHSKNQKIHFFLHIVLHNQTLMDSA